MTEANLKHRIETAEGPIMSSETMRDDIAFIIHTATSPINPMDRVEWDRAVAALKENPERGRHWVAISRPLAAADALLPLLPSVKEDDVTSVADAPPIDSDRGGSTVEWQLIDTAPKADRDHPFLAYRQGGFWSLCYWSDKWNDWADYWDGDTAPDHPPTHWMPLPTPPCDEPNPLPARTMSAAKEVNIKSPHTEGSAE